MHHNHPRNGTGKARRRRKQGKDITGLLVIFVLVALLLFLALLVSRHEKQPAASAAPSLPASASSSSAPAPSSLPEEPAALGEFDLAGVPPLFNKDHFIPAGYTMDLVDIGNGHQMDAKAAKAYLAMAAAAKADGIELIPISGYRSHEHQTRNYNNSIAQYKSQGYSEAEAIRRTQDYYAIPGTSEHEAGLAVDVNSLETSFEKTNAFAWLQKHAAEFGFILRYRQETKEITNVSYEPWHYRFVGKNHAEKINELGITLEEYWEQLQ